jgi:hypothetical protein
VAADAFRDVAEFAPVRENLDMIGEMPGARKSTLPEIQRNPRRVVRQCVAWHGIGASGVLAAVDVGPSKSQSAVSYKSRTCTE